MIKSNWSIKVVFKKRNGIMLASALLLGALAVKAAHAAHYHVVHVEENDTLNVRAGAGVVNSVIATIPADGAGIELTGDEAVVGSTRWAKIIWEGESGWVSKHYLQKYADEIINDEKLAAEDELDLGGEQTAAGAGQETLEQEESSLVSADEKMQEVWVLQCGNRSPFWKAELLPESMNFSKQGFDTRLVITHKQQDKNRWNTALKTVVAGKNDSDSLKMTIKYAYSKRCYDTLSGLRVPYKVTTEFNGEELTGCCRAVKMAMPLYETPTKLSMN